MKKIQLVAVPEESKKDIAELSAELRDCIVSYAARKNFDIHPAVPFLAIDILRNAVLADLVKHLEEKDKNSVPALPSFQMGQA